MEEEELRKELKFFKTQNQMILEDPEIIKKETEELVNMTLK